MDDQPDLQLTGVNRLIADFMRASASLEVYLQERRPLSEVHIQSIELTLKCLQNFLKAWKQASTGK
ncbi:MAG: hypothetical protein LZF60_360086 [Nitrospira sp.]|nr:MAG: hypothetical protein LZF60_360086 [Nitrospira sp.]